MAIEEMVYQRIKQTYNVRFSSFPKDYAPGRAIYSKPKVIEGILIRTLIYPNGVSEEFSGWLSICFENLNDVRLELDVNIRCMGQAVKELIRIQKRSAHGVVKGSFQKLKPLNIWHFRVLKYEISHL